MNANPDNYRVKIEVAKVLTHPEYNGVITSKNHITRSHEYENCRWPFFLSIPFMHILTFYVILKKKTFNFFGLSKLSINTLWFDGLGLECRKVKDYATTWKAMDIIYNHPFPKRWTIRGIIDEFYWHGLNCQALRNRYKLMKDELRSAIIKIENQEGPIRIISLACGSAEAQIEIISEFKIKGKLIIATLVDIDAEALTRAKTVARRYGVEDQIECRNHSAYQLSEICSDFKPHIIEMLGLFDYIDQDEAIAFTKIIRDSLDINGLFLTSNISPNIEQHFLKWVIDWPMIYRNPKEIADIAIKSGFNDIRIIFEPLIIHGLLIARKN